MGCSASRPDTVTGSHHHCFEDNPSSSSLESTTITTFSSSNSHFSSPHRVPRALSLQTPLVHHLPSRKGDTHHLVSLTSTTYGSLRLVDLQVPTLNCQDSSDNQSNPHVTTVKTQIPSNPVESFSPDSVINTWELMDGLDDESDYDHTIQVSSMKSKDTDSPSVTKPLWKHLSEESFLSKMDPNVVSSYKRALSSRQLGYNEEPKIVSSLSSDYSGCSKVQIVIYFTSLRGIRKTYEDCCTVRMIFKGFRVAVDERDISMDSTYRRDLQSLVGGKTISLPQVFIKGKHIGGVEEIKRLNEIGELGKLLEEFPVVDPKLVCKSCGDARFLPCPNCCGSRKVFDEEDEQLRRCLDCNENGLIRCPDCACFG